MSESLNWRTSSYTGTEKCVEVADNDLTAIKVRDSKNRSTGILSVGLVAWSDFVEFSKNQTT